MLEKIVATEDVEIIDTESLKDKAIYSFYWNCGRHGDLDGIFIAKKEDVKKLIGKRIYFGEVLGKHSEIYGDLNREDLTIKTDDPDFIKKFEEIMGSGTISGFNPLDYWESDEDENYECE